MDLGSEVWAHPDAVKAVLVRGQPDAAKTVLVRGQPDAAKTVLVRAHPDAAKTVLVRAHPDAAKTVPKMTPAVLIFNRLLNIRSIRSKSHIRFGGRVGGASLSPIRREYHAIVV